MTRVVIRGETVYECDVCKRRTRVPTNRYGLDLIPRCNITARCRGSLRQVTAVRDINSTAASTPSEEGVTDWSPREVLYTHKQPIRSAIWVVKHNLQNIPIIHAFVYRTVNGEQVLIPNEPSLIETIDANTTHVHFSAAEAGQLQCVSLVSKNLINYTAPPTTPLADIYVSSPNGELTIATLNPAQYVKVQLRFMTSPPVSVEYLNVDAAPSVESAWVAVDNVIINGKQYTVRSFDPRVDTLDYSYFTDGTIPSGVSFVVESVDGVPITLTSNPNELLFLLSTSPYTHVDRVYDKYINASHINAELPEMYYATGAVFASPAVVRSTYPLILIGPPLVRETIPYDPPPPTGVGFVAGAISWLTDQPSTSMMRLTFISESVTTFASVLSPVRTDVCGVSGPTNGYFAGGWSDWTYNENFEYWDPQNLFAQDIDRFTYSTETDTSISTKLTTGSSRAVGINSLTRGFFAGGMVANRQSFTTGIEGIRFDNETTVDPTASLAYRNTSRAACGSQSRGYIAGGWGETNFTDDIEAFKYNTETVQMLLIKLVDPMYGGVGTNSTIEGFFMHSYGEYHAADVLSFITETINPTLVMLAQYTNGGAGLSSTQKGYAVGGFTEFIHSVDFVTHTAATVAPTDFGVWFDVDGIQSGML